MLCDSDLRPMWYMSYFIKIEKNLLQLKWSFLYRYWFRHILVENCIFFDVRQWHLFNVSDAIMLSGLELKGEQMGRQHYFVRRAIKVTESTSALHAISDADMLVLFFVWSGFMCGRTQDYFCRLLTISFMSRTKYISAGAPFVDGVVMTTYINHCLQRTAAAGQSSLLALSVSASIGIGPLFGCHGNARSAGELKRQRRASLICIQSDDAASWTTQLAGLAAGPLKVTDASVPLSPAGPVWDRMKLTRCHLRRCHNHLDGTEDTDWLAEWRKALIGWLLDDFVHVLTDSLTHRAPPVVIR